MVSTALRPRTRSFGERRDPTTSTIAVNVASSATTANIARNRETVSVVKSAPEGGQRVGGVDGPVGGERAPEGGRRLRAAAGGQGGHGVEDRHDLAQGPGRGEVLLLVGDVDLLDPLPGGQAGDDGLYDVLRSAGPGRDPDDTGAGQGCFVELFDAVDALHQRAAHVPGHL